METGPGASASAVADVWQRIPGVLQRRAPTSVLVACAEGGAPVRIEGSAIVVWEALETPGTTDAVVGRVAAALGGSDAVSPDDVEVALSALAEAGIVTRL